MVNYRVDNERTKHKTKSMFLQLAMTINNDTIYIYHSIRLAAAAYIAITAATLLVLHG